MNTRQIASEYRLSQWAQRIGEQKASGQSISKWCEANGFRRQQYFYYQKRLREAACRELLPVPQCAPERPITAPNGWMVCASDVAKQEPSTPLTIEIGICKVIADANVDTELLAKVCRVLVSIC